MGVADLLFVVLVADASGNAMQGDYRTVGDGLVLIATLVGWNYALDWAAYRWKAVSRLLEPPPVPLVRHGKVIDRSLRQELLTREELIAKLRGKGIEDLSAVRIARLEGDGELSVTTY